MSSAFVCLWQFTCFHCIIQEFCGTYIHSKLCVLCKAVQNNEASCERCDEWPQGILSDVNKSHRERDLKTGV